jgi:hypothetical protein
MKLAIVSTLKPIIDNKSLFLQENFIKNIIYLKNKFNDEIDIQLIIVGNEEGVESLCQKYQIINRQDYKKFLNFPLISEMLRIGNEYVNNNDVIMWTNGDIIYNCSLIKTILSFKNKYNKLENFSLVGQRLDWENYESKLNNPEDINTINKLNTILNQTQMHVPCGIDYFIHSKTSIINKVDKRLSIPAIIADQRILHACYKNVKTIDCTRTIIAIHQGIDKTNRDTDIFKKIKENNLNCTGGWLNITQCKEESYLESKDYNFIINFKPREDINWYPQRLQPEFKKKIEKKYQNIKKNYLNLFL